MRRFLFLLKLNFKDKNDVHLGGSPGLVVMGRDSSGFESWHRILDGYFFTYSCGKNCNDVCLKRPKINEKEAGVGPFLKNKYFHWGHQSCGEYCKTI